MASFIIEGGHRLSGDIYPQGAKNEVLQIVCATLLTPEEIIVHNIPDSFIYFFVPHFSHTCIFPCPS